MSARASEFPEYGDGGDFIGARRTRRAFRWGVTLCAAFVSSMWISEQFLRYGHADRLYLSAITKPPQNARNMLRQAVIFDERSENPSSKYLEALAEREEDDLVIPTYERAYKLDPSNPALAMRYGCRLFRDGQVTRARELFRAAAVVDTQNALPVYLEAAVLPWMDESGEDIDSALGIVKQASGTHDRVVFPEPLWFDDLPAGGYWYTQLRRQVIDSVGEPLVRLTERVASAADRALTERQTEGWNERLSTLEAMGRHIALGALREEGPRPAALAGGSPQAALGLYIAFTAVQLRKRLQQQTTGAAGEQLVELGVRIESALQAIRQFEAQRFDTIQLERDKYAFPIRKSLSILAFCLLVHVLAYLVYKIMRVQGAANNVHHGAATRGVLIGWLAASMLILCAAAFFQRLSYGEMPFAGLLAFSLWAGYGVAAGYGLLAPAFSLPNPRTTLLRHGAESTPDIAEALRKYRAAYISLLKRYYGVQLGGFICVVCLWSMGYRIILGIYPWQIELLATGMEAQELDIVRQVLSSV